MVLRYAELNQHTSDAILSTLKNLTIHECIYLYIVLLDD
jgi:hypothetical protein